MTKCAHTAAAVFALACAGTSIFLAGVAALHSACNNDELPLAARLLLFTSSGIPSHESCAWQQGWQWWVVFGQCATLCLAAAALFWRRGARAGLPVLALLAVWTSFIMPLCNQYLALHYNLEDAGIHASAWLTSRAVSCCVAGTILTSVANVLILFTLGCRFEGATQGPAPTLGCCQKGQPCAAPSPAPRAVEVSADAAGTNAFIAKSQAATAAMV